MDPALQQFPGLRRFPLSSSHLAKHSSSSSPNAPSLAPRPRSSSRPVTVARAASLNANAQTRERQRLKELFAAGYERCRTAPMEGVSFTVEDFLDALDKYDFDSEVGAKVKGTVFVTDMDGAIVDITAKSSAYLPVQEACIHRVKHVAEASIFPGFQREFIVIGENEADDGLILSQRAIQYDLAWERCRQLQAEDVVKVKKRTAELLCKELPLKFVEIDEGHSRLVLSNHKSMVGSQAQLAIGSVVLGTVQSLKPYGVFIDIGGPTGLLHVSQISHDIVSDVSMVLQPGDVLKWSTECEPTPADMICNPELVFEKADEMAQIFQQRITQVEAMARAEMMKFRPESGLSWTSEAILDPLTSEMPANVLA